MLHATAQAPETACQRLKEKKNSRHTGKGTIKLEACQKHNTNPARTHACSGKSEGRVAGAGERGRAGGRVGREKGVWWRQAAGEEHAGTNVGHNGRVRSKEGGQVGGRSVSPSKKGSGGGMGKVGSSR